MSGSVFVVADDSPKDTLEASSLYFCCEGCLAYFREHRGVVLRKRGWAT